MIKKPEDIKKVFVNGARPTESDFADLIDSFVPRDSLPDDDLEALHQIIAWWRSRRPGDMGSGSPAGAGGPGGGTSAPASGGSNTAGDACTATSVVTVPADGKWYPLSITDKSVGTWMCVASTIDARRSYRITNTAMAVVGTPLPARRLIQDVVRDSLFFWRTIQFEWLRGAGSSYALNVRARVAFGTNCKGLPTQIRCEITRGSSAGQD